MGREKVEDLRASCDHEELDYLIISYLLNKKKFLDRSKKTDGKCQDPEKGRVFSVVI